MYRLVRCRDNDAATDNRKPDECRLKLDRLPEQLFVTESVQRVVAAPDDDPRVEQDGDAGQTVQPASGDTRIVISKASYGLFKSCKSRKACIDEPDVTVRITYHLTKGAPGSGRTRIRRVVDDFQMKNQTYLAPVVWWALARRMHLETSTALVQRKLTASM